ncbi:hypothetical protein Ahy_A07g036740 [Arachis hypogaea]|uniref:Protein FAR1-RELATED SEQUENCE n=1 Tax=Arachis hypogaea TaxID=3818 RepID=A0A445CGV6_ARAHY|nr:hypothetical protein Ahy_A07g036740 [Arachis hypogaea]
MDDSRGEAVGEGGGDAGGTYGNSKVKFTDDDNSFEDVNEDEMIQYGEVANMEDVMNLEVRKGDFDKDYNGAYSLFGFLKKDMYNCIDNARWAKIADGNANTTLVYLEGKAGSDPDEAIEEFGLKHSLLANQMHEKRKMWAEYLCNKFCAGFRTTSHYEGINAFVNKFYKSTHSISKMI